jgi:hypothetical protein
VFSNQDTLRLKAFPPPAAATSESVGAMMRLPDYVFIHEDAVPRIGVWDDEAETWSEALIDEAPTYDPEKKMLNFELKKFAPLAYLQHRCTDYPYDSWYLRCTAPQVALLTIKTKRIVANTEGVKEPFEIKF